MSTTHDGIVLLSWHIHRGHRTRSPSQLCTFLSGSGNLELILLGRFGVKYLACVNSAVCIPSNLMWLLVMGLKEPQSARTILVFDAAILLSPFTSRRGFLEGAASISSFPILPGKFYFPLRPLSSKPRPGPAPVKCACVIMRQLIMS